MRSLGVQYNPVQGSPAIEQRKSYPANGEEASRFATQIIKMIHDDPQRHESIVNTLRSAEQQPAQVIGQMAAKIVMIAIMKLKQKTGRKPHLQLALHALKMVINELFQMAAAMQIVSPTMELKQAAGKIAGDMVQNAMKQGQQPTQQPVQQPVQQPAQEQGYLGGM